MIEWPSEFAPRPPLESPDPLESRRVAVPPGVGWRDVKEAFVKAGIAITGAQSSVDGQSSYTVKADDVDRARQLVAGMAAQR